MPIFWIDQRYSSDDDTASLIKLMLDIPCYGKVAGFSLLSIGILFMVVPYLKRFLTCNPSSKAGVKEDKAVILNFEKNPLMPTTINLAKSLE